MKSECHYCKDKELAEQSNNLCVECFNAIVTNYAARKAGARPLSGNAVDGVKAGTFGKIICQGVNNVPYGLL